MNRRLIKFFSLLLISCFLLPEVHAQFGKITIDLQKEKPEKFQNKELRSEKTGEKKFTIPRRFIQNTTSHYNYFFNANNKINAVIERARMANKDNYSELLPYYSYSLDNTAAQDLELDSVILKATAGILLHDLRSDWVDNFYLLIGKAYYLRKDFDSAAMTFQFINYNLAPKDKKSEDDQQVVGSNLNQPVNTVSISTKEDGGLIEKAFTRPPSRNDALVWQIRTLTDLGNYPEAAGLINTLSNDPLFPERLESSLEDAKGYWFFSQKMFDSAVIHMENALPNALDLQDQARREYLIAQLYERQDNQDTASDFYDKAMRHTTDPLLDIYANLNKAKMLESNDPEEIARGINRLLQMGKKDKFQPYRDIIYFSAGQLALLIPDTTAAIAFYKKSNSVNEENLEIRNQSYLKMAQLNYLQKNYKDAFASYDSLDLSDTTIGNIAQIEEIKNALAQIVTHINIIEREDSLQKIAGMTEDERTAFIKKLSKALQKERGITEVAEFSNSAANFFDRRSNKPSGMFANNEVKGDWYFYNPDIKAKGYAEFRRVWGKRQNIDNWRRVSSSDQNLVSGKNPGGNPAELSNDPLAPALSNTTTDVTPENFYQEDVSEEGLLAFVPLTPPMIDTSNKKVATSLFQLAKNYQNLLEDYPAAIFTYETSLNRFPDSLYNGELYMNLAFCYNKMGNTAKANYYKDLLVKQFGGSKYADYVQHPERFNTSKTDTAATNRYAQIYDLFIEGKFAQANEEKERADSLYGNSYWNPQLLYIQSVYYINQREDSLATNILNQIIAQFPNSPMKEKAATMIDVLSRRDSIENYLTNLQVERAKEDSEIVVFDDTRITRNTAPVKEAVAEKTIETVTPEKAVINPEKQLPKAVSNAVFTFDPNEPQLVVMMLKNVDPVYSSEARNAFTRYNRQKMASQDIQVTKDTLDKDRTLLLFSEFISADAAIQYEERLKKDASGEVSWLPANKYSFFIISKNNLEILKDTKKLDNYLELLRNKYPGNF
jgi:tetratricopeptide (TPR) repeat protein